MKKSLLFLNALVLALISQAQFNYNMTVLKSAYVPLTSGTVLNSGLWDDPVYKVPLGFSYKLNDSTITHFSLRYGQIIATDTVEAKAFSGFLILNGDLWDRGNFAMGPSLSPIRVQTTGTTPNRIFKAEVYNAGFSQEPVFYATNNDSVSYQVWMYEGSNIFEIHIGKSNISHYSEYFTPTPSPFIGFFDNFNPNTASIDQLYYLRGDPLSPSVDSTSQAFPLPDFNLNLWPSDSTVYRFTPKVNTGIDNLEPLAQVRLMNATANSLSLEYSGQENVEFEIVSIVGNLIHEPANLRHGVNKIDISGIAAGIYVLRIQSADERRTIKFMKP